MVDVRAVSFGSVEYEAVNALREAILRRPLEQTLSEDDCRRDEDALLIGAYVDEELCGCVILDSGPDGLGTLRQMAVSDAYQGMGIGHLLVSYLEQAARELGLEHLRLHARETAGTFYSRLGYSMVGDVHPHLGIPHIFMEKSL